MVILFPIAAVADYHKLHSLKQHRFIILWFGAGGSQAQNVSQWAKSGVIRATFLLED